MEDLTKKEKMILNALSFLIKDRGYPPSLRELAAKAGFKSPNTADYYLKKLESSKDYNPEDSEKYLKPKKEIYSRYKNDSLLFELCHLWFIQKVKIKDFSKLNKKCPSVRTLKTIFKNFIDFKAYSAFTRL